MKKAFFLSKGLEKFSNLKTEELQSIRGGIQGVPSDNDKIYYPTSGGGRKCPIGMVWSDTYQMCLAKAVKDNHVSG